MRGAARARGLERPRRRRRHGGGDLVLRRCAARRRSDRSGRSALVRRSAPRRRRRRTSATMAAPRHRGHRPPPRARPSTKGGEGGGEAGAALVKPARHADSVQPGSGVAKWSQGVTVQGRGSPKSSSRQAMRVGAELDLGIALEDEVDMDADGSLAGLGGDGERGPAPGRAAGSRPPVLDLVRCPRRPAPPGTRSGPRRTAGRPAARGGSGVKAPRSARSSGMSRPSRAAGCGHPAGRRRSRPDPRSRRPAAAASRPSPSLAAGTGRSGRYRSILAPTARSFSSSCS